MEFLVHYDSEGEAAVKSDDESESSVSSANSEEVKKREAFDGGMLISLS